MITVVYACDDVYIRQTIISMVSVIKHNPNAKLYLVSAGLSRANQNLMTSTLERYGSSIHLIDIEEVLPEIKLDESDRHPKTVYAKLFFENKIAENRVLYLDSDVVVEGSLEPLFRRDMQQEVVAGVLMPYSKKVKERTNAAAGQPYICDGVVLFNLELWRSTGKSAACFRYIEQYHGKPPMLSEGTLNHVCQRMIGILEPTYNLMPSMLMYRLNEMRQLFKADYYYQDEAMMEEARKKPVMIHFMNELYNRPWFEPCNHPFRDCYRKKEQQIFGKNEIIQKPLARHTKFTICLRQCLPFAFFAKLYHIKNKE